MQNKLKEKITNNNKGYLIVEIIVSFIIVMAIAFFLIQLTSKFLSQNDDTYNETVLLTDQALMTSTIMNDVNSKKLINVTKIDTCAYLVFTTNPEDVSAGTTTVKKLSLINDDNNDGDDDNNNDIKILSYGEVENSIYIVESNDIESDGCNVDYIGEEYTKKFNEILAVQELAIKSTPIDNSDNTITDSQLTISIPAYTAYSKEDYGLKVLIPYSSKQLSYKEKYLVTLKVINGTIEGTTNSVTELVEKGGNFLKGVASNPEIDVESVSATCNGSTVSFADNGTFSIQSVEEAMNCQITYKILESNAPTSPNAPSIDTAYMVPVYYDSTSSTWKIANKDNDTEANAWYNYADKQWANMVLVGATASSCTPGTNCLDSVTKHDRAFYTNQSNVGEPVSMDDILAFYVWIPRYKYKVWNINKIPKNDQAYTYNAYNDGIDIQWESGTDTSGNVSCTYYYTAAVATAGSPNETCTVTGDTSNPYYTHPAFWWDNDGDGIRESNEELTGIWVGKFETSSNTHLTGTSYGGGNVTNLTVRIVPNVTSWRKIEIGNAFTVLQNMHNASNEYGLPTTKTSVDSHMMKNTEWGAVAYLTNSIYGKCTGSPGGCTEVQINSHWDNSDGGAYYYTYMTSITGCGPSADGVTDEYDTACTEYNTTTGMLASTTGNITGVYDMSGGAYERVMGNMSSATGTYTFYPLNTSSTMPVSWYTATTSKYVDTYAYNSSNDQGQIAYNRSRLGDATGEVNITGSYNGGWYSNNASFVRSSYSWFRRGGYFDNGTAAGPFCFINSIGSASYYNSFRASLVLLG